MGPLDMVLAKAALCDALERHWGEQAGPRVRRMLSAGSAQEMEAEFKSLGIELMEAGRKEGGWEFAKAWKAHAEPRQDDPAKRAAPTVYALDEEEDEEPPVKQSLAKGLALGIGKAFSRQGRTTTDSLASAGGRTLDNAGAVTEWQGEDEMSSAAKRMFANGKVGMALAKAELAAVARSKLGGKASKIVDKVESSVSEADLALAVGEAQRKLVRAGMPRLAAKMAKKWLELRGRIE